MKYLFYFENFGNSKHYIDDILKNYLECVLWTEEYDEEVKDKTIYDFSEKSKKEATEQIKWFVDMSGDALDDISDESIGHDLWLTRNGHGSGFFDRGYDDDIEEILSYLSNILGEVYLEVGDDDKIDFIGSDKYKDFDFEQYKKDKELKKTMSKYNL